MHTYAATVHVLCRWCFAFSCVCMYAATVHMLSRQCFAPSCVCMHAHVMTITRKTQRQTMRHVVNHRHMTFWLQIFSWCYGF